MYSRIPRKIISFDQMVPSPLLLFMILMKKFFYLLVIIKGGEREVINKIFTASEFNFVCVFFPCILINMHGKSFNIVGYYIKFFSFV